MRFPMSLLSTLWPQPPVVSLRAILQAKRGEAAAIHAFV
jgi:hypothetical protein